MLQKAATVNPATDSSKKCPHCGLRNFADTKQCRRCKSDLSLPSTVARNQKQALRNSSEAVGSTFSFAWILAALVVLILGLAFFYMRQGPRGTDVGGEALVAQAPVTPGEEQPAPSAAEQNAQSEAAATQIVRELKSFQDITERGIDYDEYNKRLNSLKSDLDHTLPSFVRQNPSDQTFRQEIAAALREYTAAGNWWKTTITNSTVFTEADRNERTQRSWAMARTHLTNAEKSLGR